MATITKDKLGASGEPPARIEDSKEDVIRKVEDQIIKASQAIDELYALEKTDKERFESKSMQDRIKHLTKREEDLRKEKLLLLEMSLRESSSRAPPGNFSNYSAEGILGRQMTATSLVLEDCCLTPVEPPSHHDGKGKGKEADARSVPVSPEVVAINVSGNSDESPLLITSIQYQVSGTAQVPPSSGTDAHIIKGEAFHMNKLSYLWRDPSSHRDASGANDIATTLLRKRRQANVDVRSKGKFYVPTLFPSNGVGGDSPGTGADDREVLAVCLPCYNEEWCEMSGTLRSLAANIEYYRRKLKGENNKKLEIVVFIIQGKCCLDIYLVVEIFLVVRLDNFHTHLSYTYVFCAHTHYRWMGKCLIFFQGRHSQGVWLPLR